MILHADRMADPSRDQATAMDECCPFITGIAHLLEHMAFKGSQRVGARDYKKEAVLLDAVDDGSLSHRASPHSAVTICFPLVCCDVQYVA